MKKTIHRYLGFLLAITFLLSVLWGLVYTSRIKLSSWVYAVSILLLIIQMTIGVLMWVSLKSWLNSEDSGRYKIKTRHGDLQQNVESPMILSGISNRESMISALQSQINPHFLYNTLETIRGKALAQDAAEVADMIEILARMLRYNISRRKDYATLADELENVRNLVAIQNYRFRGRFVLIESYEDVDTNQYILPVLTLQPLVENAIHHGLEPKIGRGTINLHIFTTESKLIIQIKDDGVGMTDDQISVIKSMLDNNSGIPQRNDNQTGSSGIALCNVQQRIRLFFGNEYGLNILSTKYIGTMFEIVLPKISLPSEERGG